jgi:hypothetical protein
MAHKSTDMRPIRRVFVIFLGKEGCEKSTAFKCITCASTHRKLIHCCPCNTGVSRNKNSDLHIVDPDTNGCSLHYGLTYSELNSICVFIEFHPRISSTLVDCEYVAGVCYNCQIINLFAHSTFDPDYRSLLGVVQQVEGRES